MRENVFIILCSRLDSRRLPGKVFKKIAGISALHHILNRLASTGLHTVVAVPDSEVYQYRQALAAYPNVLLFARHGDSPLHRMAAAACTYGADWIVRVTHDDLLIDAPTVLDLIDTCMREDAGYGITPAIAEGAGVEVIKAENLLRAADKRREPTEFISYFVRGEAADNPKILVMQPRESIARPYRLTMDYPEDTLLLEAILRAVGPDAPLDDVCAYLDRNPHLLNINRLPELSIYTCAHNAEKWAGFAAASVMGLDLPRLEYVFVNDASTDETLQRALVQAMGRPRMKVVVNEENLGLASSCNVALSHCRGRYVMRLDADDLLMGNFEAQLPEMLAKLKAGAHVVYPAYGEVDEDRRGLNGHVDPRLHHHAGGAIFDKRFLDEMRFTDGIRHWDGLDLYERMKRAGARIAYHDTPTWMYCQHKESMSRSEPDRRAADKERILGAT